MKALVTGGAGFIGSHLVEELVAKGHEVVVLDNMASGKESNLAQIAGKYTLHKVDIRGEIAPFFAKVDWVFHLAGLADIVPSIEEPRAYYEVNVSGTFNVLEASRKAGVKRFIYAASSSCYGLPDTFPTPESSPVKPEYPYAHTKYLGEELVLHFAKVYKLPAFSLRLFNVYGPRSRTGGTYGAVFGVFMAQKYHGKPFTVVGDGTQTRDFTYVTDVASAFVKAAESGFTGQVCNVGSGNHYSVNHLVTLLGGKRVEIPKRPGEPDCTFADITKITKLLGWRAKVPFEEGVAKLLERIEDYKDAPLWEVNSIKQATKSWFKCLESV